MDRQDRHFTRSDVECYFHETYKHKPHVTRMELKSIELIEMSFPAWLLFYDVVYVESGMVQATYPLIVVEDDVLGHPYLTIAPVEILPKNMSSVAEEDDAIQQEKVARSERAKGYLARREG